MKKITIVVLVIIVVLSGVLLLNKRRKDLADAASASVLPAVVAAIDLKMQQATLTLPTMGIVASDVSAVLSTRISGQVIDVTKQEGDPVQKGEMLLRIDATDLEAKRQGVKLQRQGILYQIDAKKAELNALDLSLKSAREAHHRTKELLDIKGASEEQYSKEAAEIAKIEASINAGQNSIETMHKSMATLAATIREIDSMLSYATLASPIDGTVSQIMARPGDLATPGKPLVRISSKEGLYLNISLPDSVHADEVMLADQLVPLTSKNQTGETGLVQYVAPLPHHSGLIEGQFVNVNIVIYKGEDVIIPVDALLTMDGSSSVFVLSQDGSTKRITVNIKARGVEGVVLNENLAGQKIILAKPDILLRVAAGVPVVEENS